MSRRAYLAVGISVGLLVALVVLVGAGAVPGLAASAGAAHAQALDDPWIIDAVTANGW